MIKPTRRKTFPEPLSVIRGKKTQVSVLAVLVLATVIGGFFAYKALRGPGKQSYLLFTTKYTKDNRSRALNKFDRSIMIGCVDDVGGDKALWCN
jgi:uncharacterized protein YxeA